MTISIRAGVVTGAVGVAGLATLTYCLKVKRKRACAEQNWANGCGISEKAGGRSTASSPSASTSSTSLATTASLPTFGSAAAPEATSLSPSYTEPWQGRGVIRALGVKAPEESIMDAMTVFYERVLADDETKDVEIEMANGAVLAHSVILSASSDAIKGLLRHSAQGSAGRKLAWSEYPIEVGTLLLRLLYTGTVDVAELCGSDKSADEDKVPLSTLLGAFELSMIYLITHLLPSLVQALQHRLAVETFNLICTAAIKVDAMALRLYCLQYARGNPQELCYEDVKPGMRVRALRQIDHEHADVPAGTFGTVEWGHGDWLDIHWSCHPSYTNGLQEVLGSIEVLDHAMPGKTLRQMYDAEEFSPEVMSELATIWGQVRPSAKRRTLNIM